MISYGLVLGELEVEWGHKPPKRQGLNKNVKVLENGSEEGGAQKANLTYMSPFTEFVLYLKETPPPISHKDHIICTICYK